MLNTGKKLRGESKTIRRDNYSKPLQEHTKPHWIKVTPLDSEKVISLKKQIRNNKLHTVCEEAFCPNIGECFSNGTATFMVLGDVCTRRCSFCDVAHGRPLPLDPEEPLRLAQTVQNMNLKYVVITSVDRDDLDDGGSYHFVRCIKAIRNLPNTVKIEILTPDFKKCLPAALDNISQAVPDVLNHNIETVPRLYKTVRPGSSYEHSLNLIQQFKIRHPEIPTKSGIMLGLGEQYEEVINVLENLVAHGCEMLTVGQYLQPSKFHHPVVRYVHPDEFLSIKDAALNMGFKDVASGPLVRSSYHADQQSKKLLS